MYRILLTVSFSLTMGFISWGQVSENSELFQTLKGKDSLLFDAAFNTCQIEILNALFAEDFEFYHDRGGVTNGKEAFVGRIAEGCSKLGNAPQPAKRNLVVGSLEVYPLYDKGKLYGAVQHGVHSFEFLNQDNEYQQGDIAKFTHVWIVEGSEWKLKRELSYDHQSQ